MELICFCWMLLQDAWDWLADWWDEPLFSGARVRRLRPTFKPSLEGPMEERIVPAATDVWIAPASAIDPKTGAANWDVGTNWSTGHSPAAGDTAVFASAPRPGGSGSDTPCLIPAGDNLPTLGAIQFNNWKGTLTISSDLAANTVSIAPRAGQNGSAEVIINSGSHLYALQSLSWTGGNVSGDGSFEVGGRPGTDTINGTDATDKPTLGCLMDIGTSYLGTNYPGNLSFTQNSQWLAVIAKANINVNANSSLTFLNQAPQGQNSVTAISNGDALTHSIIVNGGTVTRSNVCELFVGMGINVQPGGQLNVTNPGGAGVGPLHFTGQNPDGLGLEDNGGQINVSGDLTSDNPAAFEWGTVNVAANATLTLGVNLNSTASYDADATFILQGTLVPHGGFNLQGGQFGTGGSSSSLVKLDSGNTFTMTAGEIAVSNILGPKPSAEGRLTIKGDFSATGGEIVADVDSQANNGVGAWGYFEVQGSAIINTDTSFVSEDLSGAKNVNKTWLLFQAFGPNSQGTFDFSKLPAGWSAGWKSLPPSDEQLLITEKQ